MTNSENSDADRAVRAQPAVAPAAPSSHGGPCAPFPGMDKPWSQDEKDRLADGFAGIFGVPSMTPAALANEAKPTGHATEEDMKVYRAIGDNYFASMAAPAAVAGSSEHYDEVRATLTGLHTLCENISGLERRVGPLGSHARGYTHKITAALRHLDALAAAPTTQAAPQPAAQQGDAALIHLQDLKNALAESQELRQRLTLMEEHARGEVWRWQADDSDDLATMGNRMGVLIYACDLRALLAAQQAAPGAQGDAWNDIFTLPDSDDLVWLYCQDTNTIDGPVEPRPHMVDSWTHWAPAEAPSTAAIDAARSQAKEGGAA